MAFSNLFRSAPGLDDATAAAVRAWQSLPEPDPRMALERGRWVVADVETTGLNPHADRLIAIGAVAVEQGRIDLRQSFQVTLRQEAPSDPANILVHGIATREQVRGVPEATALASFLQYAGKDPLLGFHAPFDATAIGRALRRRLGLRRALHWLDLAELLPLLYPEHAPGRGALDDWLEVFGIGNYSRHNAVADAFATAQLWLALLPRCRDAGIASVLDLASRAKRESGEQWQL